MTIDLDGLLESAVVEAAVETGRGVGLAVRQFGAARVIAAGNVVGGSATRREYRSPFGDQWSDEENALLREWAGVLGDEEISERLGRSVQAVRIRRIRNGLPGPTVHPDYLTAQGVAKALGVDVHAVCKWIDLGIEWWSTGQVADYHGVDHKDVARYIYAGKLPAVRWSNWWVLRSEATRPGLRFYKGKGGTTFDQSGTPDGDAFLVLAVAVGIPWEHVRRMARMGKGAPQSRHAAIVDRGLVPALIRAYELPARYRKSDGATWCDWREVAHRFPVVARAWERFHAGRRLSDLETHALAGVLRAAVVWARGADDPLAQSLWGNKWPGRKHLAAGVRVYRELAAVGGRAV